MNKHTSALASERAAAAKDRSVWRNWKPTTGAQMAFALVDATMRSINNGPVEQRVALNVRNMR